MTDGLKIAIGGAATVVLALLVHLLLDRGDAFIEQLKAKTAVALAVGDAHGITIRFPTAPLSRTALLSGDVPMAKQIRALAIARTVSGVDSAHWVALEAADEPAKSDIVNQNAVLDTGVCEQRSGRLKGDRLMLSLIAFDWVWLAIALAIGLLTAWTVWGRSRASNRPERSNQSIVWPQKTVHETRLSDANIPASKVAAPPTHDSADASDNPAQLAAPNDDLGLLKGVTPQLVELLRSLGVNHFAQIANWTSADIDRIDSYLGIFRGSITRDQWVEQARHLAVGDLAGFRAHFGGPWGAD